MIEVEIVVNVGDVVRFTGKLNEFSKINRHLDQAYLVGTTL